MTFYEKKLRVIYPSIHARLLLTKYVCRYKYCHSYTTPRYLTHLWHLLRIQRTEVHRWPRWNGDLRYRAVHRSKLKERLTDSTERSGTAKPMHTR